MADSTIPRLKWTRTWSDKTADFVARDGERQAGRIYRHHDKVRWLWAAYLWDGTGQSGIAADKQAAADNVTEVTMAMAREGKDRRQPAVSAPGT